MRKYILPILLFMSSSLYADTLTTGSLKLLQPATGQEDVNRSWADKLNVNFEIIDSSVTTNITAISVVATDTTTILNLLKTTATSLSGHITTYNTFSSTVTDQFDTLRSTVVILRASTSTLGIDLSQRTIVISDEGGDTGITVTAIDIVGDEFVSSYSGSTVTLTHTPSAGGAGGGTDVSTITFTMYGGGAFLSTANPIGTTVHQVRKSSWEVVGVSAFINLASSVGATMFKVWHTTSVSYGITWSTITPQIVVTTNSRESVYISTKFAVNDRTWIGIGIDTIPISGLQPEDWGVNLHLWKRLDGQTY